MGKFDKECESLYKLHVKAVKAGDFVGVNRLCKENTTMENVSAYYRYMKKNNLPNPNDLLKGKDIDEQEGADVDSTAAKVEKLVTEEGLKINIKDSTIVPVAVEDAPKGAAKSEEPNGLLLEEIHDPEPPVVDGATDSIQVQVEGLPPAHAAPSAEAVAEDLQPIAEAAKPQFRPEDHVNDAELRKFMGDFEKDLNRAQPPPASEVKATKTTPQNVKEPPLPSVPLPTKDDVDELRAHIRLMGRIFYDELKPLIGDDLRKYYDALGKMDYYALKQHFDELDTFIISHDGLDTLKQYYQAVCFAIEMITSRGMHMRTEGYTKIMVEAPSTQKHLKRILVKRYSLVKRLLDPEVALIMQSVSGIYMLDQANRAADALAKRNENLMSKPAPAELVEKFKDLDDAKAEVEPEVETPNASGVEDTGAGVGVGNVREIVKRFEDL